MRFYLILGVACVAACMTALGPLRADAPQRVALEITLQNSTVSVGEPVILNYRITNGEGQNVASDVNHDPRRWLGMELDDEAGQSATTIPYAKPLREHAGSEVPPHSTQTGTVLLTHWLQISHPGHYTLTLQTHVICTWDSPTGEVSTSDQTHTLSLTVTARDPARLRADAEGLRQAVLQDKDIGDADLATETLFSMNDPVCLPVWQELVTDPHLDASRASNVMGELAKVGTAEAADALAEMASVAPQRSSWAGVAPVTALDQMRVASSPALRSHIDHLLANLGVPPDHRPLGTAGGVSE